MVPVSDSPSASYSARFDASQPAASAPEVDHGRSHKGHSQLAYLDYQQCRLWGACYPTVWANGTSTEIASECIHFLRIVFREDPTHRDSWMPNRGNPTESAIPIDHPFASCPPIAEQRAIAHILGTLDDKIELNRRMNETLEAMARAIFKSWFVDFDPVRAKAEGRDRLAKAHRQSFS